MMEEGKYSIEFLAGINPGLAFDWQWLYRLFSRDEGVHAGRNAMDDGKLGKTIQCIMQTHMFKDVQCHIKTYMQTVMDACESVLSQAGICILHQLSGPCLMWINWASRDLKLYDIQPVTGVARIQFCFISLTPKICTVFSSWHSCIHQPNHFPCFAMLSCDTNGGEHGEHDPKVAHTPQKAMKADFFWIKHRSWPAKGLAINNAHSMTTLQPCNLHDICRLPLRSCQSAGTLSMERWFRADLGAGHWTRLRNSTSALFLGANLSELFQLFPRTFRRKKMFLVFC